MGSKTGISWTQSDDGKAGATWNPTDGCACCSPGCKNCYAMRIAGRFSGLGAHYEGLVTISKKGKAVWNGAGRLNREALTKPLSWREPRRVFVNSMSDLFFEVFSNEEIAAVFGIMAACPQHTFQILTKRAKRMREWFEWIAEQGLETCAVEAACWLGPDHRHIDRVVGTFPWPLPNVWMGVSIDTRKHGVPRIDELRPIPSVVRFLSCEPLLEDLGQLDLGDIDWLIAGCESGPGARLCDVDWVRSLRDQCAAQKLAFFLKQAVAIDGQCTLTDLRPLPRVLGRLGEIIPVIGVGEQSREKGWLRGGTLVELPYLDGVQHATFPEVRR